MAGAVSRWALLAATAVVALAAGVVVHRAMRRGAASWVAAVSVFAGLSPVVYQGLVYAQLVNDRHLRWGRPWMLAWTVAAGAFVAFRFSGSARRGPTLRRGVARTLMAVALFAATLAAAEPELGTRLDRLTVIVAVDRSRSIDLVPASAKRIAMELKVAERAMRDGDRIGTVVFGADAVTEDPPRPRSELPPPQHAAVGRDGTDIEAAIRRSLAEVPADSAARIVVVSDGVQTRGDALAAAAAAVGADVPVDTLVLEQKPMRDVRVVALRAPPRADEGEALDLRVVTSSTVPADVEVRLSRDGELIRKGRAHIEAGEDTLRLRETGRDAGLHRYDVEVTALDPSADGAPDDNAQSAFVHVRGQSIALVIDGDPGKTAPMARALEAAGFLVRQATASGVPADLGELAAYDLVVFGDVAASDLSTSQVQALASYARDLGGGLVLTGGDRSMGPGGYARTPVEEVSPVAFDLKNEKRRASLAEVVAIDYSGSMGMMVGGQTKLALANEAAARSATLLGPGDRLGVEHVDTVVKWTIPLEPVTDAAGIESRIRAVGVGGGGIYTDVALAAGYGALDQETVNLKHLLLFADGDDAEQIAGCRALVSAASHKGITTSVISLGRGHDTPELEVLSKLGGGRFYLIDDATRLPAVFSQETILAAKSALHEEPFRATVGAPGPATRGLDMSHAPPLGGYVVTVPKGRASVLLRGPEDDPVLATWAAGLGKVAAFTSDFKDRWGASWLAWPDGVKLFGELGRDSARKQDDPRVRVESDATNGELHVRADAVGDDGRAQTFRRLSAHVAGPGGFSREVPLEAVGAGRYVASLPLDRPGVYVTTARDDVTGQPIGTTGSVLSSGEELRPTGSDRALLGRIAAMTGGRVRETLAGLFEDRVGLRFTYTPLGPRLVLLGAVALVLSVGARRLAVPEVVTRGLERAVAALRRSEWRRRRAQEQHERSGRAEQQERVNLALLARKHERVAARGLGQAPAGPTTARPLPSASVGPTPVRAAPSPPPAGPEQPSAQQPLSSAERLAKKRRERR